MSLGKQMTERLRLLAKQGPEAAQLQSLNNERQTWLLQINHAERQGRMELFDYDRYSATLHMLEVGGYPQLAAQEAQTALSACAAELARQLSYLEEPLAVWELDSSENQAQLRSFPPQRDDEEVSYWEVTVWAGPEPGARIMRYRWTPGMIEREVVAYPAAFTLLARMIDSLNAALVAIENTQATSS